MAPGYGRSLNALLMICNWRALKGVAIENKERMFNCARLVAWQRHLEAQLETAIVFYRH
jgi:hypothetical protein